MKKIKIFALALTIIILCIVLAGCSSKPTYYSKKEINKYVKDVFGEEFTLVDQKKEIENEDEKTYIYEYVYENNDGLKFSVYSKSVHPYFDAMEMGSYEKQVSNNYIVSVMNKHKTEIDEILNNASFDKVMLQYGMYIYLDSYTQIEEVAEVIEKLDRILQFKYDYSKTKCSDNTVRRFGISIYLKPDVNTEQENWKDNNYKYFIADINISNQRLYKNYIVRELKEKLESKNRTSNYYHLPDSF